MCKLYDGCVLIVDVYVIDDMFWMKVIGKLVEDILYELLLRIDCFEILKEFGSGGFGIVVLVKDFIFDCLVVIKVLCVYWFFLKEVMDWFICEVKLVVVLFYLLIVLIFEMGSDGFFLYIVFVYCLGMIFVDLIWMGYDELV